MKSTKEFLKGSNPFATGADDEEEKFVAPARQPAPPGAGPSGGAPGGAKFAGFGAAVGGLGAAAKGLGQQAAGAAKGISQQAAGAAKGLGTQVGGAWGARPGQPGAPIQQEQQAPAPGYQQADLLGSPTLAAPAYPAQTPYQPPQAAPVYQAPTPAAPPTYGAPAGGPMPIPVSTGAAGPEHVQLEFQESTAPKSVFGKMGGKFPLLAKKEAGPPDASFDPPGPSAPPPPPPAPTSSTRSEAAVKEGGVFSASRYQKYFDVDTFEVLHRLAWPFYRFWKPDFFTKAEENPDLYGPFWVPTTCVFLTAVTGNLAGYIDFHMQQKNQVYSPPPLAALAPPPIDPAAGPTAFSPPPPPSSSILPPPHHTAGEPTWYYDVNMISWAILTFYLYVGVVPVLFWGMMKYFKSKLTLVQVWCIYGYSLSLFLPAIILNVIPNYNARWAITMIATLLGAIFLMVNFGGAIKKAADDSKEWMGQSALGGTCIGKLGSGVLAALMMIIVLGLHLGLGLVLKMVFFTFKTPKL